MTSSKKHRSLLLLPFELVEEILYRIPIKSLVRFKSVSKQWYALFFNDKRFIYKHLDLSKEQIIGFNQKSIQLFNLETKSLLCQPTLDELDNYLIVKKIHCDWLLLCNCTERGMHGDTSRKLAVWNPVLSRVKWIKPSSSYKIHDVYGLGYDNVSRDNYKILRINTESYIKRKSSSEVEIYEFKSKLWRSVDATIECYPPWRHVSMNGNMYWISQREMVNSKTEIFIQSFDFSTETFKHVCCVPNGIEAFISSVHNIAVLSGFGVDRLSLLHQHEHVKTEVWVTSKVNHDDGIVSWSKYFNVITTDPPTLSSSFDHSVPINFILKTNKIMLWCVDIDVKKKNVYTNVYEMGYDGRIKKLEMTVRGGWGEDKSRNVYVPSLVPVPE